MAHVQRDAAIVQRDRPLLLKYRVFWLNYRVLLLNYRAPKQHVKQQVGFLFLFAHLPWIIIETISAPSAHHLVTP